MMELLIKALLWGLCLPIAYLAVVTFASCFFRKKSTENVQCPSMGVLIPAHNEAAGIGQTIMTVLDSTYPVDRLKVMVIADNCRDATVDAARKAGAQVFERRDPNHTGKGRALDWFLTHHQDHYQHLNAITIIDADVKIDPACLSEIGASLSHPEVLVVQAYNGVSNPGAGWRPALCDAAFNVFNHLRLAGTAHLSGTAVLKGLGMGFRTGVLKRYGWPAHSVVEDQEFTLMLLIDGINVHYNPDAVVRSDMVTTGDRAAGQRVRWEGGRFSLVRRMTPMLVRLLAKKPGLRYLCALCELVMPPLSLLILWATIATVSTVVWLPDWTWLAWIHWLLIFIYVVSGQIQRRAPLSTWLYLAAAPLFVAWKIPLYLGMLTRRKTASWSETSRTPGEK